MLPYSFFLGACLTSFSLLGALPNEELSQLRKDHTKTAFSLYQTSNPSQDNFIFSPYSITTCLSMVYVGARGETQNQMQKALNFTLERKNLPRITASLQDSFSLQPSKPTDYKLSSANSLWIDQEIFLLTDFRYAVEKQFKATVNKVNFSKVAETLTAINQWVSDQTQGKISPILSSTDIDPLTRLVLVNALYFQGSWAHPFNPTNTQDWPFHPTPESSVPTQMMQQVLTLPYYENELLQMVAIPFQGKTREKGQIGFVALLPKSGNNFSLMLSELPLKFDEWLSSLAPTRIDLKLPKFTQNTRLDLNKILREMGMEDAFTSEANLSGIDGIRDLFINKVIHQAVFSIDEKGVVAAAATVAVMNMMSALPKEAPTLFYADRPFLYFILDLKSQEILFMGMLAQPKS